jgi:hypothetical protein
MHAFRVAVYVVGIECESCKGLRLPGSRVVPGRLGKLAIPSQSKLGPEWSDFYGNGESGLCPRLPGYVFSPR